VATDEKEGATFTGQEYMPLFKAGRRLSTKMKTNLKNNDAFSNVVVRFCEIFTCPLCK
jgi:hypothetical protein